MWHVYVIINIRWIIFKLKKISNVLFGKIQNYLFVAEFQSGGLARDHGLLWVQNAIQFGISSNEIIEIFFDKYLTIDHTIFFQLHKYINTNELVGKKSTNLSISIS